MAIADSAENIRPAPLRRKRRVAERGAPPDDGWVAVRGSGGQAPSLYATRALDYGEVVLRERPLLLVPADAAAHLRAIGSDAMVAVARQLGDSERLAAFAAFSRLPQDQRDALLAMGVSAGCTIVGDTKRVVSRFLQDFPHFRPAVDWELFARVVGVVSDRGTRLPSGERAVYFRSDQAAHSCAPNAVVETLGADGLREVRVIAHEGISENEDITLSFVPEEVLWQPPADRAAALVAARRLGAGAGCSCGRCAAGDDPEPARPLLESALARGQQRDDSEEALRRRLRCLERLDAALPFAMAAKALARARVAQACEERPGGVGNLADEVVELYEAALEETNLVLGQKGLQRSDKFRFRLEHAREQLG